MDDSTTEFKLESLHQSKSLLHLLCAFLNFLSLNLSATSSYLLRNVPKSIPRRDLSEGEGDGSKFPFQEAKRRYTSSSFNGGRAIRGLSSQELATRLEPLIRVVVRDAVENAIEKFCCSTSGFSANQTESSGARTLQLHFHTNLPSTLFTGSRIESEDNIPVKLVLVDVSTNRIVDSGPLSSIKVEIIPLDGDFNADDQEDWSEKDFNSKIVHERAGKRPLVTGDLVVTLSGGVGELGDICFTDNSSWIRCRKFRLGAKVQSTLAGVRIKEAKSVAFVVKDHRGESYKKHHPPSSGDEIWRLERIAKDGAFHKRLVESGISTVENFLQLYITDPASLRSILGGGVSSRTWEIIIKHATACILDDKLYTYHWDGESIGLVFNSIFKVVAATFDGQNYQSLDKLDSVQMRIVEDMKRQAYRNLDRLVPVDEASIFGIQFQSPRVQDTPPACLGLPNAIMPIPHEDQLQMVQGSSSITNSQPYTYGAEGSTQLEFPMVHNTRPMQVFSPALRNSFIMRDFCYGPFGDGWGAGPSGSHGFLAADDDNDLQDENSYLQGNNNTTFYIAPTKNRAVNIVSPDCGILFSKSGNSPKSRWFKIRAAIKWVSLRRDVAAKRTAQLLPYYDF